MGAMVRGHWWRNASVYQVYIRSFADGNGDGLGDLPGLRERLPYLRDLNVDALWINPWYVSPMVDGGYDIADYRNIDPRFGTLRDAEDLIKAVHAAGLKVIVDIVPNHCSAQHPWFKAAVAAAPGSAERMRFWFHPGRGPDGSLPPNDWQATFGGAPGPASRSLTAPPMSGISTCSILASRIGTGSTRMYGRNSNPSCASG